MTGKVKAKVNTLPFDSVSNRFDLCFEHWICSGDSTDKHTRSVLFENADDSVNLQFNMLDLNTGFALAVPLSDEHTRSHKKKTRCPMELSVRYG